MKKRWQLWKRLVEVKGKTCFALGSQERSQERERPFTLKKTNFKHFYLNKSHKRDLDRESLQVAFNKCFPSVQSLKHSEHTVGTVHGSLAISWPESRIQYQPHDAEIVSIQKNRTIESHRLNPSQSKLKGPGQIQWGQIPCRKLWYGLVWRWSLSCNRDPRVLEIAGTFNIYWGKLQAPSGSGPRESSCVPQRVEQ